MGCNEENKLPVCKPSVSRQIVNQNNTLGRDGESAYLLAVRKGFQGTEDEFNELNENNSYAEFTW